MKSRLAFVALLLLAVAGGYWLWPRAEVCAQSAQNSFVIDETFDRVRKILVRTKATEKIVALGESSEFIGEQQQIDGIVFGNALSLGVSGELKVRTDDPYIGQHLITLDQDVELNFDRLVSNLTLSEGSDRLRGYDCRTEFLRDGDKTVVNCKLTLTIKTTAPKIAAGYANRRVKESAESALGTQERAIRQVVEDNRHKKWILPEL